MTTDPDANGDANGDEDEAVNADENAQDDVFAEELSRAKSLLDDEDVDAAFAGVVRDGEVDTTFTQRAADREEEGLQALALLAAHVRLVANEAGVEPSTVAGDAATLAGQVEEIPGSADAMPDE